MLIYKWAQIQDIPNVSGVYAWYYTPDITDFDIAEAIKYINTCKDNGDYVGAKDFLENFFDKYLFKFFAEDPYRIKLRGPLKPRYEGIVEHVPSVSPSLIERIFEEPLRLKAIKGILKGTVPAFASPMYIGMSETLGVRVSKHKYLIEKFNSAPISNGIIDSRDRDHSFARQVAQRGINPPDLFVIIKVIDEDTSSYVDIENLLNRIHFPILGRN